MCLMPYKGGSASAFKSARVQEQLKDSCLSLIRISRGQEFCSNYREIRIIESILQGFLKDGDFTYVPIRERFWL